MQGKLHLYMLFGWENVTNSNQPHYLVVRLDLYSTEDPQLNRQKVFE